MRDLNNLPDLELALVQTSLAWHDAPANRERFATMLEQARGAARHRCDEHEAKHQQQRRRDRDADQAERVERHEREDGDEGARRLPA